MDRRANGKRREDQAAAPRAAGNPRRALLRLPQPFEPAAQAALTAALEQAVSGDAQWLLIDLGGAPRLDDDQLALLLTLHSNAGRLKDFIGLLGVTPGLVRQLADCGVSSLFHLDGSAGAGNAPGNASGGATTTINAGRARRPKRNNGGTAIAAGSDPAPPDEPNGGAP